MTDKSKITKEEVLRLANLSRINIVEEEVGKYAEQLDRIGKAEWYFRFQQLL